MAVSFQGSCTYYGDFTLIVVEIAQFQYVDVIKDRSIVAFHDNDIAFCRDNPSGDVFGIYSLHCFLAVEEKKFSAFGLISAEHFLFFIGAGCQTGDDAKVSFQFAVE